MKSIVLKKKKLFLCFVDVNKVFDRAPRNVFEWVMKKKGTPQVVVMSMTNLYDGAKSRVRADCESEEFMVRMGMHQGSVLLLFLLMFVVDVVTKFGRMF